MNRVVINKEGEAVLPAAAARLGILPQVLFIRDDGWVLGAPNKLARETVELFPNRWDIRVKLPQVSLDASVPLAPALDVGELAHRLFALSEEIRHPEVWFSGPDADIEAADALNLKDIRKAFNLVAEIVSPKK